MRRSFPILLIFLIACGPFFYEAPPSIGTYPERLPAKRWQHLFQETSPLDPALPDEKVLDDTCRKLPETLVPLAPAKRFAEIDRLLAENRGGPYSVNRANYLHELRELAAKPGLLDEARSYLAKCDTQASQPLRNPPGVKPWNMEEDEFKTLHDIFEAAVKEREADLEKGAAAATLAMKPYWMVRRAALFFNVGRYPEAAEAFAAVIAEFPEHPRAEVAMLMRARSLLEESRREPAPQPDAEGDQPPNVLRDEAELILNEFIARHPKGRFTPDAEGWLGALAWDRKQYGRAVKQQLTRLDRQSNRETTRSVLRECDMIFKRLLEGRDLIDGGGWLDPDDVFDVAAVARHPLVSRLFVQHCIDPIADVEFPLYWDEGEDGGRETINFINRRIFLARPLVRLILKELGREITTVRNVPDTTTLTMLAWAATIDGEHAQALALLDRVDPAKASDETLHARAIVLQRLQRHEEAVAAFDRLKAVFPHSVLTVDLDYRRSLSLFRAGHMGRAIAAIGPAYLTRSSENNQEGKENPASGPQDPNLDDHLLQWLDTMVQFCPLDELEAALAAVPADARYTDAIRSILRARAFAAERFDLAEKYLTEGPVFANEWEWPVSKLAAKRRMTREEWDVNAAPLAALIGGAGGDPAATHLQIAREWMARRGLLTLPAVSMNYFAAGEEEKQDLLRRRNALELGFSREQVERELDSRDEASHALAHALKAAESKDPLIAAPALELANQCLFRRAEFSIYQKSRALETDDSGLSKSIHRRLVGEFPKSAEAKRAVWFDFSPIAGRWMPGDYNPSNSASALMRALEGPSSVAMDEAVADGGAKIDAILARFTHVAPNTPLPKIRKDIETAFRDLTPLRAQADPESAGDILAAIKRLDSLRAAAALRGITTADFIAWANDETDALPAPFKSLLDYQDRVSPVADADGNVTSLKNDTIDGWRTFLELYPDSPMAEAASFRMTRLMARTFRTSRLIASFQFPEAPIPNGYKHLKVVRADTANDPQGVLSAIRDHEKRFPMGRYQDDINLLRAGAFIDEGDFTEALAILCNILENPVQRDLHVITALEFADVAQRLLNPEQRVTVVKAMRRTPGAMERLKRLVYGDTFLSRLQPLMPWLTGG